MLNEFAEKILTIRIVEEKLLELFSKGEIISEIRNKNMCQGLVIDNQRLGPHSKGDDSTTSEQLRKYKKNDPVFR